jgi:tetratricopeptide (TPR) repeat protein
MIQPVRSGKSTWFVYWIDLEEPVPGAGGEFFLPTLLVVCDAAGTPLAAPEVLEELDQVRVENHLIRLFERMTPPDRLSVGESEDWEEDGWKAFSEEHQIEIRFQRFDREGPASLHSITRAVVLRFHREGSEAIPREAVARGLVASALRVRSAAKRQAMLRAALERDAECAPARVELADLEFQNGNWKNCLAAYEDVIARESGRWPVPGTAWWTHRETRPYLRALYGRAMTLWHQGHYSPAAEQFEELVALNPTDNQGARFFIPLLRLLGEEPEAAATFFEWYQSTYPSDYVEPAFSFGWALTLSLCGAETEAKTRYRDGILKNIYIAPMLLEEAEPPRHFWHPNDRAEPTYAAEFIDSYAILWDREPGALRLLRETWHELLPRISELITLRSQMSDFQDQRYEPDYKKLWQKLVEEEERMTTG